MAMLVINSLEMIQVGHQYSKTLFVAFSAAPLCLQVCLHRAPVGQAGQRVGQSTMFKLLAGNKSAPVFLVKHSGND